MTQILLRRSCSSMVATKRSCASPRSHERRNWKIARADLAKFYISIDLKNDKKASAAAAAESLRCFFYTRMLSRQVPELHKPAPRGRAPAMPGVCSTAKPGVIGPGHLAWLLAAKINRKMPFLLAPRDGIFSTKQLIIAIAIGGRPLPTYDRNFPPHRISAHPDASRGSWYSRDLRSIPTPP